MSHAPAYQKADGQETHVEVESEDEAEADGLWLFDTDLEWTVHRGPLSRTEMEGASVGSKTRSGHWPCELR